MSSERWSDDYLEKMKFTIDPLADNAVRELFEKNEIEEVNKLLQILIVDDKPPPEDLPQVVKEYLDATNKAPDWADSKLILEAQNLYLEYGLSIGITLFCASLTECYTQGKQVIPLWLTQQLVTHVHRRLMETTTMIMDVMSPGGMDPEGHGVRSAQRVRLMHAAIRHLVLHDSEPLPGTEDTNGKQFHEVLLSHTWDKTLGMPINQEMMAFTLLTFSYVTLRSLDILGIALTDRKKEAYLHTWNVVGHYMGVYEELLAHNMDEAEQLFEKIMSRNRGASRYSLDLTSSLVDYVGKTLKDSSRLIRVLHLYSIPKMLMVELLSRGTPRLLGIRLSWTERLALLPLWIVMRVIGKSESRLYQLFPFTRKIGEWTTRKLYTQMVKQDRGGKRGIFNIPDHLAAEWDL